METGDSAASDGDEQSGNHVAKGRDLIGETGESRDSHVGVLAHDACADDTYSSDDHHAVEQEGGQVVTRLEQDPNGSYGSNQNVNCDNHHPSGVGEVNGMEVKADNQAKNDADNACNGSNADGRALAVYKVTEDDSHYNEQNGDHCNRSISVIESALLGEAIEGACNDGSECCYYQQKGEVREDDEQLLSTLADVGRDNLADGLTLVTNRCKQSTEVMGSTEEDTADEYPEGYGNPTENCSLDRSVDGACTSYGRKVMSHKYGSLCGDVVHAVLEFVCGGNARSINAPLFAEPLTVGNITNDEDSAANQEDQYCIHSVFSPLSI